jgi:hypothetical protein
MGNSAGQARAARSKAITVVSAAAPPPRVDVTLAARNPAAVTSRKFGSAPQPRSVVVHPAVSPSPTARAPTGTAPSTSQPARRSASVRHSGNGVARRTSRGGSVSGAVRMAAPSPSRTAAHR